MTVRICSIWPVWSLSFFLLHGTVVSAQTALPSDRSPDQIQRQVQPPPEPFSTPAPLPELDKILPDLPPTAPLTPNAPEQTIPRKIQGFRVVGSRVFSQNEIDQAIRAEIGEFQNQELTIAQLARAADAVTQLYVKKGYLTTGAVLAEQTVDGSGMITLTVSEGRIDPQDIRIKFTGKRHRLRESYIRDRIALATRPPLNYQTLVESLQLLRLNPLIQNLQATLSPSPEDGKSLLDITVTEGQRWNASVLLDNNRSPSVGSFRRQLQGSNINLFGGGDSLALAYANTKGSNTVTLNYIYPLNARDGTLSLNIGVAGSRIVEKPFDVLDIEANSQSYELSYRQPIVRKPTREIALGFTLTRRDSEATLLNGLVPFPSIGAESDGSTRLMALRFFQDATWRSSKEVISLRSQFNLGLNFLGATVNERGPDSRFISWLGQAQWLRQLGPGAALVLRGDMQFADRALLPSEQFGIGGQTSVRGYRQDQLLTDNGIYGSAELRIPIVRNYRSNFLLQVVPFVDFGTGWNNPSDTPDPDPRTLVSTGLGLRLQANDRLSARFDWGIPLVSTPDAIPGKNSTWQEDGFYLSVIYSLF
jgi:hemolysin activation/secretion protein